MYKKKINITHFGKVIIERMHMYVSNVQFNLNDNYNQYQYSKTILRH